MSSPAPDFEPCGYCPPGLPCNPTGAANRARRGACLRFYDASNLSPVTCVCGEALPLATANAGERVHPTCGEETAP